MKLFPYQHEGAKWLASRNVALLADEMGLGKSAQAIYAADIVEAKSIIVICPAIARINWQREFDKFSKFSREIHVIEKRTPILPNFGVVILSYEGATFLQETPNHDVLIIDERHYLKSITSKRTHAIYGKTGIVRKAKRIWELSGTPAPNNAGELWTLLYTFGATKLSYHQFVDKFCETIRTGFGIRILGNRKENLNELRTLLSHVMLRRIKDDVMKELPRIFYKDLVVPPTPFSIDECATMIKYHYGDGPKILEDELTSQRMIVEGILKTSTEADAMKALEAMANSVSTLRRYTGLQKVGAIADIVLDELENKAYEKVVIFAVHRDVIEMLRGKLRKFQPVTLYGGLDPKKKQSNIDRFQTNPKVRVMIANIQAAGTSVTLTAAHHVVFIEQDWVPGNNAQAVMRCHRIGQTKTVFVRVYALANSVDEKIARSLKRKMRSLTEIFDPILLTNNSHGYNY